MSITASKSERILIVLEAFQVAIMIKCCTLPRDVYCKTKDICSDINVDGDLNYWMDKNVLDQGIRLAKSYFLKFPICLLNEKYEGTAALRGQDGNTRNHEVRFTSITVDRRRSFPPATGTGQPVLH